MARTRKRRRVTRHQPRRPPLPSAIPSKPEPVRRRESRQSLTFGNHITFLFVGVPPTVTTFHTKLMPAQTQAHLKVVLERNLFVHFPDEFQKCAELYRSYLYSSQIYSIDAEEDNDPEAEGNAGRAREFSVTESSEWNVLAGAYLFGHVLRDEKFANTCVDALIEKVVQEETFPTGLANDVWPYTEKGDCLRKLIVDLHVLMGEKTGIIWPHEDADASQEFFDELNDRAYLATMQNEVELEKTPWESDACREYHSHVLTEKCTDATATGAQTRSRARL